MSAGLPNSKQVIIHGFITSNGQKMSKSLGNVINPFHLVKRYGTDAVRYYLLREIPPFADGDYSDSRMKEIYNSELANELGNLVLRITNIAKTDKLIIRPYKPKISKIFNDELISLFDNFQFAKILETVWIKIKLLNKEIDQFAPWKKNRTERENFLIAKLNQLNKIGYLISPFLPKTAETIIDSTQGEIKKISPLFPKIT